MDKKHILITGGAGFIGSNMVEYQLSKGNEVCVVDNLATGQLKNIEPFLQNPCFRFEQADLASWPNILNRVEWADEIYHLAASVGQKVVLHRPIDTITNNIRGCEEILKAMDKVNSKAKLLIASTSELYCHSEEGPDGATSEESIVSMLPHNFLQDNYRIAKYVNEIMALSYRYEKRFHCVIARIFNTIGINQTGFYGMVVPTFIHQAIHNEPITVYGDGKQTRSFIDVRDTVVALDKLLNTPGCQGEIVNVGNDKELSILDLAYLIKRKTNSRSEIQFMDYSEAYGVPFMDVRRRRPDLKKLKRLTGFKHQWTVDDTIDNILSNKQYLDRLLGKGKIQKMQEVL